MCHAVHMTTMTAGGRTPEFTLGWRMRLALETGGLSVNEMAERLGYSRSNISRWLNDEKPPRPAILDSWAQHTQVDRTWLESGGDTSPTPPGPGKPASDKLTRLTERKRSRSQGHAQTTRHYFTPETTAA